MKIVVLGNEMAFEQLKNSNSSADWQRVTSPADFKQHPNAGAFFYLDAIENLQVDIPGEVPFFINSVVAVLENRKWIRINGWNGFLENETWEIAGDVNEKAQQVLNFLNKKIVQTANEPGFISPRIISMIINEAYYAREEGVSTTEEIDTAMKLGTNYPQGPFEWAQKIGHKNIVDLLQQLSISDKLYSPALSLLKEARQS